MTSPSKHRVDFNLPNILTLLRIVLIPVLVVVFFLPWQHKNIACTAIFGLAAITDWLDGYIARKMGIVSPFGEFLDPVADKLMVAVTLVLIVQQHPIWSYVIPAVIIVGREISVSALREWMAEMGSRATVGVKKVGKFKTIAQMVALLLLLYREPLWILPTQLIGHLALAVAAGLTIWSMVVYLKAAWPMFQTEHTS